MRYFYFLGSRQLDFADPMDNFATRRLRAFRFYATAAMVLAAGLYINAAVIHSPAFQVG